MTEASETTIRFQIRVTVPRGIHHVCRPRATAAGGGGGAAAAGHGEQLSTQALLFPKYDFTTGPFPLSLFRGYATKTSFILIIKDAKRTLGRPEKLQGRQQKQHRAQTLRQTAGVRTEHRTPVPPLSG